MNRTEKNRVWIKGFQMVAEFFILVSTAMAGAESLTIVSPKGPLPRVVAAEGKVHQDSAADLCDYLSRVTGRAIKPSQEAPGATLTIHVGPDAFVMEHAPEVKKLFADGFVLKHLVVKGKHHILISGIRWNSSRWAVEEFLKQFCGVRWLFPDDVKYGEIVPSRPTIMVDSGLDQKHEPDYLSRAQGTMYFFDKTRNYLRLRPFEWPFGNHEFQYIFDREDFKAHPEWFALFTAPDSDLSRFKLEMVGRGLRQRWHWDHGNGWQICLSNPETVQHAVEYARDYFAKNPESPVVSMGHNDGDGWCECSGCAKFANSVNPPYTISEQYWYWVNQVARELAKTHPDKRVATIAYGTPAIPPRFRLEKNIALTMTVYMKEHLDLVRQWKAKCSSINLYSYAYGWFFVGFRHYPHAMRDFLKWGHDELGAVSHVSEVYGNWSFDGPKYHYMQALQWNVNADPDQIMREYCHDWFGEAAGPMQAFWDRLESIYERRGSPRRLLFYQWLGFSPNYDEFNYYTLDDVTALDTSIAEAEGKTGLEADRFRVVRVADAWKYYRTLLLGKLKYVDQQKRVMAEAIGSSDLALKLARELAELQCQKVSFMRQLRAYPHINPQITGENYLSVFSKVSIFSDMRTLLDDLCEQVTTHMIKNKGKDETEIFWRQVRRDDTLYESARTQIYMIEHLRRPNVLANGDFETDSLSGWKVDGQVNVTSGAARHGRHAAQAKGTLSQSVPVRPQERYRLTVWGKVTAATTSPGVSADVTFRGSGKDLYPEPTYSQWSSMCLTAGWAKLQATFTTPPTADTAVISLASSGKSVLWDDVTLEKIQDGPVIESGVLSDDFSESHLNGRQWVEAPAGSSGLLPTIQDGSFVFDNRPMATLVSLSDFNGLLSGTGDHRYRLRLHISKGDGKRQDGSVVCGIMTGAVPISIQNSGVYFSHVFLISSQSNDQLQTYCYQDSKQIGGVWYEIKRENNKDRDVWYTFYFDTKNITIYAGGSEYDETDRALIGTFEHKMTSITSKGPVFLKLTGNNAKVDEISLTRPGLAAGNTEVIEPIRQQYGPRRIGLNVCKR